MKVTSICPLIVSPKAKELIELFEEMGFEGAHVKSDIENGANINTDLKDTNGNRIDIASSEVLPKDLLSIKINVDDFDEAYEFLKSKGFVNTRGDKITITSSSKDTFMVSPTGLGITLSQHLK
ncbi:MAG: hypothetical protein IJF87_12065 [Erysipelotrichaceae bacterium]|nr:hypothetical protein [Erysipelotrichaceae bacterium]MBQ6492343.1 hypothetical protein [Erysipelotrichaceae bacterium]